MSVSTGAFQYVSDLVRHHSAIQLGPGKEYLVEGRIGPLARRKGFVGADAVDQYLRQVQTGRDRAEIALVVEALTTNETSWFRDSGPFTALRTHILPELRGRRGQGDLRIWSAACSTGQEPYSIAMSLLDAATQRFTILGTDLNTSVLAQARAGRYSQLEVNRGLPAPMLVRYFSRQGASWQVNDQLRSLVTFQQHNLLHAFPLGGPFDVVFLRNVLIYFDLDTKRDILSRMHRQVRPGGFLVLGAAETTVGLDPAWERVEVARGSIYRLGGNA
jgi:chemotaxis protein methyltransferase CheR